MIYLPCPNCSKDRVTLISAFLFQGVVGYGLPKVPVLHLFSRLSHVQSTLKDLKVRDK